MNKLAAMRAFAAVMEQGSFSGAARVLGVPKTRVSQRVRDLEASLGVRLLHRTTRVVSPTEEGRAYHEGCGQILAELDALEATLSRTAERPSGRLHVACMSALARALLLPHLAEFQRAYPEVALRLSVSDRLVPLVEDGFDCAIRGGALDDSRMVSRHLRDALFGIYAAPSVLEAGAPPREPADLAGRPRLLTTSGRSIDPTAWTLVGPGGRATITGPARFETDDDDAVLVACLGGAGFAICPDFAAAPHVAAGRLVHVLPDWSVASRPIYLVYPTRLHLAARLRCFMDWVTPLIRDGRTRGSAET
jgi:LysR family transcriptional regulator for bpeEF and oprC